MAEEQSAHRRDIEKRVVSQTRSGRKSGKSSLSLSHWPELPLVLIWSQMGKMPKKTVQTRKMFSFAGIPRLCINLPAAYFVNGRTAAEFVKDVEKKR